jgi:hypothetical protein
MEPDHGDSPNRNEGHEHDDLRYHEWGLRLGRRERRQEPQLLKRLDHADEGIQIEGHRSRHDNERAPGAGEPKDTNPSHRRRQQRQRD